MNVAVYISVLGLVLQALPVLAQPTRYATLEGTVVDAETEAPLPGAHVFIAVSMIGTATDDKGRFRLERVPLGKQRLYVSMIGFEPVARDTLLRDAATYTFDLRLNPTIVEIGEVTVTGTRDRRWKKRLRRFERMFVGESAVAEQATILNPEVLDFKGGWGSLVASAGEPLIIENKALGYRLQYFLKEFSRSGSLIKYDGEPLFEELQPENDEQAALWEANRRQAFYGSFRHFMLSLLEGTTKEEGFVTYRRPSLDRPYTGTDRFYLNPERLLREGPTPEEKELRFSGFAEVVYVEETEEERYLVWQARPPWSDKRNQLSWLELSKGPTLVDQTGEIIDPYGVTVYGYFAFERIGDLLPKEYRPEPEAERSPK